MAVNPTSVSEVSSTIPERKVAFAALHHRDYRRYFFVIMLSQMGDNIEHVISYWLLYQKFHSPVLAGFAVISHWTPFLFFAVYFRRPCRPARLPPRDSSGPGDVRQRVAHLGHFISH